jgi:hypothetical protein
MLNLLQGIDWAIVARVITVMVIVIATPILLWKERTVALYTAVLGGLALLWVVCTVDLKEASRIVGAGFEIDRRVAMADDAIRRLAQAESDVRRLNQRAEQLALLLIQLTRLQLQARYMGGSDPEEAAIRHKLDEILELAIPDATARQQWREQQLGAQPSQ